MFFLLLLLDIYGWHSNLPSLDEIASHYTKVGLIWKEMLFYSTMGILKELKGQYDLIVDVVKGIYPFGGR